MISAMVALPLFGHMMHHTPFVTRCHVKLTVMQNSACDPHSPKTLSCISNCRHSNPFHILEANCNVLTKFALPDSNSEYGLSSGTRSLVVSVRPLALARSDATCWAWPPPHGELRNPSRRIPLHISGLPDAHTRLQSCACILQKSAPSERTVTVRHPGKTGPLMRRSIMSSGKSWAQIHWTETIILGRSGECRIPCHRVFTARATPD